jgi:integrase
MFRCKYEPIQWRLMLDEWPAPDRRAFEAAVSKASYRKAGQGAHWAPQTRLLRVASYGKFLQFLKLNGECDEIVDPADRLTPDRLTRYIATLKEHRAPASVAPAIVDLGRVSMAMFPTRDWSWISQHPDRPTPQEIAAARKSKRTFDPAALLVRVLDRLDEMLVRPLSVVEAIQFRDLTIIAFMCAVPLRAGNVCDMRLGETVLVYDDAIAIDFGDTLVKNDQALNCRVPDFLMPYLRHYLATIRPVLLAGRQSRALWINWRHGPLDVAGLDRLLVRMGKRLLGCLVRAHDFRYSAVTHLAKQDPGDLDLAQGILGHKNARISISVYNKAGSQPALRHWNVMLHRATGKVRRR